MRLTPWIYAALAAGLLAAGPGRADVFTHNDNYTIWWGTFDSGDQVRPQTADHRWELVPNVGETGATPATLSNARYTLRIGLLVADCNRNGLPDGDEIASGAVCDFNHNGIPDQCESLGDMNCDGVVDFGDIDPFVLGLTDPVQYHQQYPDCDIMNGDVNGDGYVSFPDIDPFVALLSSGATCP